MIRKNKINKDRIKNEYQLNKIIKMCFLFSTILLIILSLISDLFDSNNKISIIVKTNSKSNLVSYNIRFKVNNLNEFKSNVKTNNNIIENNNKKLENIDKNKSKILIFDKYKLIKCLINSLNNKECYINAIKVK